MGLASIHRGIALLQGHEVDGALSIRLSVIPRPSLPEASLEHSVGR